MSSSGLVSSSLCGSRKTRIVAGAGRKDPDWKSRKQLRPDIREQRAIRKHLARPLIVEPEWIQRAIAESDILYNHDYYKYGPYGPYRYRTRGLAPGEARPLLRIARDDEELEEMEKREQERVFLNKWNMMNKKVGLHFFYVFVRSPRRIRWQLPWKEWTLAANIGVESPHRPGSEEIGALINLQARHHITKCVSWCRPDLIWVKRPSYHMRFQPQEDLIWALYELLDPETELNRIPGTDAEWRLQQTYYSKLCERLGVQQAASEQEVLAAFNNLNEESIGRVLDHVLFGQPVELPFTRAWKRRQQAAAEEGIELGDVAGDVASVDDEDDDVFDNRGSAELGSNSETGLTLTGSELGMHAETGDPGFRKWRSLDDSGASWETGDIDTRWDALGDPAFVQNVTKSWDTGRVEPRWRSWKRASDERRWKSMHETARTIRSWTNSFEGVWGNSVWKQQEQSEKDPRRLSFYRASPTARERGFYPAERYVDHFDHHLPGKLRLDAAVRPFTYRQLLQEIVFIRHQCCHNHSRKRKEHQPHLEPSKA